MVETRLHKTASLLGDLGLAVVFAMLLPLLFVIVGAPVVLLVRAILAIAQRF